MSKIRVVSVTSGDPADTSFRNLKTSRWHIGETCKNCVFFFRSPTTMERLQLIEKRARSLRTPPSVLYELLLFECVARPRPCTLTSTEIIIIIIVVITVARAPRANDQWRQSLFPFSHVGPTPFVHAQ